MVEMKKALILTSHMGFGHTSAAHALALAFEKLGMIAITKDPIKHSKAPEILKYIFWGIYDETSKQDDLYQLIYKITDTDMASTAINISIALMIGQYLYKILKEVKPDVIIAVHPDYLEPLKIIYNHYSFKIPVVTVLTDLVTIHRRWFNSVSDITIVPTKIAYKLAVNYGITPSKIRQIGIPTRLPQYSQTIQEVRQSLGLDIHKPTLLAVGSKRVSTLTESLRSINHSNFDVQLLLVAGGDDELYQQFQSITWHVSAHIYDFTNNISDLMYASDIVISKAGGLIVSECLAFGKPMFIVHVIEGQETGNAEYVLENRAGVRIYHPEDMLENFYHWFLDDKKLLRSFSSNAKKLGKPQAAFEIAQEVKQLIQ